MKKLLTLLSNSLLVSILIFSSIITTQANSNPSNIDIFPNNDYFASEDSVFEFKALGGNNEGDNSPLYDQSWTVFNKSENRTATNDEAKIIYQDIYNNSRISYLFHTKDTYDVILTVCNLNGSNCLTASREVDIHVKSRPSTFSDPIPTSDIPPTGDMSIYPANDYFAPEDSVFEFKALGGNEEGDRNPRYHQEWNVYNISEQRLANTTEVEIIYHDTHNNSRISYHFIKPNTYEVELSICDINNTSCKTDRVEVDIHVKSRPTNPHNLLNCEFTYREQSSYQVIIDLVNMRTKEFSNECQASEWHVFSRDNISSPPHSFDETPTSIAISRTERDRDISVQARLGDRSLNQEFTIPAIPGSDDDDSDFSSRCYTYGFYGLDDWYIIQLLDRNTTLPSNFCTPDGWEILDGSPGLYSELDDKGQELWLRRAAGGQVRIAASKDGQKTRSKTYYIERGNNYQGPDIPVDQDFIIHTISYDGNIIYLEWDDYLRNRPGFYAIGYQKHTIPDQEYLGGAVDIHTNNTYYRFPADGNIRYTITVEVHEEDGRMITSDEKTFSTQMDDPITPEYPPVEIPPAGFEDEVRVKYQNDENPFPDTGIDTLEGIAAAELYRRAVIGGFPDGEFKGWRLVNRAEAAKFLLLARDVYIPHGALHNPFWDVYAEDWYGAYVIRAAELGIIDGYPDGSFGPANTILVSEFIKMLALNFDIPIHLPHNYKDADRYPDAWFWAYAGAAQIYDLFPDSPDILNPERELTRREVAIAIYQFLKNRDNPLPPVIPEEPIPPVSSNRLTCKNQHDPSIEDYDAHFEYIAYLNGQEPRGKVYGFEGECVKERTYIVTYVYEKDGTNAEVREVIAYYQNGQETMRQEIGPSCVTGEASSSKLRVKDENTIEYYCSELENGYGSPIVDRVIGEIQLPAFNFFIMDPTIGYLCTEPARARDIGGYEFPVNPRYQHMPHLGQLFTAYECGEDRLEQVSESINISNIGSRLVLKEAHYDDYLAGLLNDLGFNASGDSKEWTLDEAVDLEDLMELRHYAEQISFGDCVHCG